MTVLKVLICGGGCSGPALAYWLSRCGHQVTVVERFPALRTTGAQIDLRAQGIEVVKRMGLLDTVRSKLVHEPGMSIVDSQGTSKATIMVNTSGQGSQSATSEYEIMRGDLVRILYDATDGTVNYIFGKTVDRFQQDDKQVVAYFSDGSSDTFDLLVGADGQGSRIRKAILPPDSPSPYRRLGIHIAYSFIPRTDDDSNFHELYFASGGRLVARRSHNPTETQVYLFMKENAEDLSSLHKAPIEQQKKFWTSRFADAGWQTPRFLEGIKATDNFYCQDVVQVLIDSWHQGRVVLLGDAAYCPSPLSAMGTTGSFVGAYVLAGEINRHRDNLHQAFVNYEQTMRPFVNELQKIYPSFLRCLLPDTRWGISIIHFISGWTCYLRIPELLSRFMSDDKGGWKLPDYPELYERSE